MFISTYAWTHISGSLLKLNLNSITSKCEEPKGKAGQKGSRCLKIGRIPPQTLHKMSFSVYQNNNLMVHWYIGTLAF